MPLSWYLTVVSVNWGRGYQLGEFKRNVQNVLEFTDGREHVVIGVQELDEADAAPEHKVFASILEDGTEKVGWATYEPIVLSPPFDIQRPRVVMTMDAGLAIGAPKGTGPRRHCVSCIGEMDGVKIGFANTHPHRNMPNQKVQAARRRGQKVFKQQVLEMYKLGVPVIWTADQNDPNYPRLHWREKTAIHRGLDYIRYIPNPKGAQLELLKTGTLNGTIDPHDPIWARFKVTSKAA